MSNKDLSWITSSFVGSNGNSLASIPSTYDDFNSTHDRPWMDEFPPDRLESLAVHKKKIMEVADWLANAFSNKERKILLITGPPGSGKTAAVRVLAKENNIEVREWTNSSHDKFEPGKFVDYSESENATDSFVRFLLVASKYNSVCMTTNGSSNSLLLVEELPGSCTRDPQIFHGILRTAAHSAHIKPLVFILSESSGQDKFTKKMFPPELQEELSLANISFNPVSSTLLTQALNRIIYIQSDKKSYSKNTHKETIDMIVKQCNGDVRSAVNTLEFLLGKKKPIHLGSSKRKRRKKSEEKTQKETSSDITSRDTNLLLFRTIGKVLYCKRQTDLPPLFLPPHLTCFQRPHLLEDPEDIIHRTPVDNKDALGLFLHHNGPPFFKDIQQYSDTMSYLGDSDILQSYWTPTGVLESYGPVLAVRGFMFNLEGNPCKTFRSLTGPSWYNHLKLLTQEKLEIDSFRRTSKILSIVELATNVVPLMKTIRSCRILGENSDPHKKGKSSAERVSLNENTSMDPDEDFFIDESED